MSKSFQNFISDLDRNKSPLTKKVYADRFKELMAVLGVTHADVFTTMPPTEFEDKVKAYIDTQVKNGKGYSFLNQTVSAVKFFCTANRINLNFAWLFNKVPKPDTSSTQGATVAEAKPYNKGQIELMHRALNKTEKDKAVKDRIKLEMGIMYSGGARIGALNGLLIEKSLYIEKYDLVATQAYPNTQAAYWIILTPTVSKIFLKVIGKRRAGFVLTNSRNQDGDPLSYTTIKYDILEMLHLSGIKEKGKDNGIMMDHGFRKFHSTQLEKAGLSDDHISRLRGSKKGLKGVYQLPTALETIELTGYEKAIPFLTVNI